MGQPVDFSSERTIPSIPAWAFLTIPAWSSAEARFDTVVGPLDTMLRSAGIGRVGSVDDKAHSSEHFLTGVVSHYDRIVVELDNFRSGFREFETALKSLGIGGSIYYVLDDGRDVMSVVSPES